MPSTVQSGDSGPLVKELQQLLCNFGYLLPHQVDGDYGADTASAVEQFQAQYDVLPVDGIVGPGTWSSLEYHTTAIFGAQFFLPDAGADSSGSYAVCEEPAAMDDWQVAAVDTTGPLTIQDVAGELRASSRPTLYQGGPEDHYSIELLAEALTAAGYPPDETWTDTMREAWGGPRTFDRSLHHAVKQFQEAYGLTRDGIVGELTWATLVWVLCGGEDDDAAASYPQPDAEQYPHDAVERRSIVLSQDDIQFKQWLRGYGRYLEGSVSPWEDSVNLELWAWADTQPEILDALEALREEDHDNQLGIWADGGQRTNAQQRQRERRRRFLQGLNVMTSGPFGGAAYTAAKALGADEDAALSAGELFNNATNLVGEHVGGSTPEPEHTDGDPGFGQYPR